LAVALLALVVYSCRRMGTMRRFGDRWRKTRSRNKMTSFKWDKWWMMKPFSYYLCFLIIFHQISNYGYVPQLLTFLSCRNLWINNEQGFHWAVFVRMCYSFLAKVEIEFSSIL
jgi:hypothetical protein